MNRYHGYIIAGDLRFIENKDPRKVTSKGTNFREARTINWNRCKYTITKGIRDCSQKLSSSNNKIKEDYIIAWKNEIMLNLENRINNLKQNVKPKKTNLVLQRDDVIEYLKKIQTKFILVPIDKSANKSNPL